MTTMCVPFPCHKTKLGKGCFQFQMTQSCRLLPYFCAEDDSGNVDLSLSGWGDFKLSFITIYVSYDASSRSGCKFRVPILTWD